MADDGTSLDALALSCFQHPDKLATYALEVTCPLCGPDLPDPHCEACHDETDRWMTANPLVTFTHKGCGTPLSRENIISVERRQW